MGRVSVYTPQLEIPVVNAPLVRPSPIGEALQNVGDGLQQAANSWDRKQKHDATAYVAEQTSALRLKYARKIDEDNANGNVSDGYTGTVLDSLERDYADITERAPNKYAREMWQMSFADIIGQVDNSARDIETRATLSNRVTSIQNSFENNSRLAIRPGVTLDQVLPLVEENKAAAATKGVPVEVSNGLQQKAMQVIDDYMLARIKDDPEYALQVLDDERLTRVADPSKIPIWKDQAQNQIERNKALKEVEDKKRQKDLAEKVGGAAAQIELAGKPLSEIRDKNPELSREVLESAGLKVEADELEILDDSRASTEKMANMTPAERSAEVARLKEQAQSSDLTVAKSAGIAYKRAVENAAKIQQDIQADPYNAVKYDKGVQAASEKYLQALESNVPEEITKATSTMMSAVLQAQRKQGVPEALITIASETQIGEMKAAIEDARGEERFQLIEKWRAQYGNENLRYLRRQMKTTFKDSPRMAAVFSLDSKNPDSRAVAATLDVPETALIDPATGVEKEVRKSIQARVRDNRTMKDFVRSMAGTSDNLRHVTQMGDLAVHAATVFVKNGMSEDAAVTKAINAFMSPFTFEYTYAGAGSMLRIPAEMRAKSKDIVAGTLTILNPANKLIDLSKASFDPRAKGVSNPVIKQKLETSGKWLATPTGARLTNADGVPVFIDGKPVAYTWSELARLGAGRGATVGKPNYIVPMNPF